MEEQKSKANYLSIVFPLIGVLIGGLISFGGNYYSTKNQEKKDRFEKIENSYLQLITNLDQYYSNWFSYYLMELKSKAYVITMNDTLTPLKDYNLKFISDNGTKVADDLINSTSLVKQNYEALTLYTDYNNTGIDSIFDYIIRYRINDIDSIKPNRDLFYTLQSMNDTLSRNIELNILKIRSLVKNATPELKQY